jgi:hypothetical protein
VNHLLNAKTASRLLDRMNNDGAFSLVARDMNLNLSIKIDHEARLIKFRDGAVHSIDRFVPLTEPVDIAINGSRAFWQKILAPVPPPRFQNLYAAVRAGTCEVSGNAELYSAYFAALTRMIDVMREIENSEIPK